MITSKPKQTAFRNKESIRCHWRKEVKASDLVKSLGFFIRCKCIAALGQCMDERKKQASDKRREERREEPVSIFTNNTVCQIPPTSK